MAANRGAVAAALKLLRSKMHGAGSGLVTNFSLSSMAAKPGTVAAVVKLLRHKMHGAGGCCNIWEMRRTVIKVMYGQNGLDEMKRNEEEKQKKKEELDKKRKEEENEMGKKDTGDGKLSLVSNLLIIQAAIDSILKDSTTLFEAGKKGPVKGVAEIWESMTGLDAKKLMGNVKLILHKVSGIEEKMESMRSATSPPPPPPPLPPVSVKSSPASDTTNPLPPPPPHTENGGGEDIGGE